MSDNMFDRKDITADEAREIVTGVGWHSFVENKIKQCNKKIRDAAEYGLREISVDILTSEQCVWDKIAQHFVDKAARSIRKELAQVFVKPLSGFIFPDRK